MKERGSARLYGIDSASGFHEHYMTGPGFGKIPVTIFEIQVRAGSTPSGPAATRPRKANGAGLRNSSATPLTRSRAPAIKRKETWIKLVPAVANRNVLIGALKSRGDFDNSGRGGCAAF